MTELFRPGVSESYVTYQLAIREDFKIRYSSTYVMGEVNRTNYDPSVVVEFIVSGEHKCLYLSMSEFDALQKAVSSIDNLLHNTENNSYNSRV